MKCFLLLLSIFSSILITSLRCDVPESTSYFNDPRLKNLQESFSTVSRYLDLPYIWKESVNTANVMKNCVSDLYNFSRSTVQLIWRNYKEDQVLHNNPNLHSLRDHL